MTATDANAPGPAAGVDGTAPGADADNIVDRAPSPVAAPPLRDRTVVPAPRQGTTIDDRGTADVVAAEPKTRYYDAVEITTEDGISRLDYRRAASAPPPIPTIRALQLQIEDVERLVNILFANDDKRRARFFDELHLTAFSGFVGDDYSVEIGLDNLQTVKNRIADAYPSIRQPIWWANFSFLVAMVVVDLAAMAGHRYWGGSWLPVAGTDPEQRLWTGLIAAIFLVPLGCAAGLFVEFLFRVNDDIPYDQLRAINPGRWKPVYRTANTVIVALVFTALLAGNILQVGISGILLNKFSDGEWALTLVIGFVTGFAFPYVRDLFQQIRPERRLPTS